MLANGSVTSASPTPSNVARDGEDVAPFVPLVQQLVEGDGHKRQRSKALNARESLQTGCGPCNTDAALTLATSQLPPNDAEVVRGKGVQLEVSRRSTDRGFDCIALVLFVFELGVSWPVLGEFG